MAKILTRFYLEEAAWAKLQYVAAMVGRPKKDVAELIILKALSDATPGEMASKIKSFAASLEKEKKGGKR